MQSSRKRNEKNIQQRNLETPTSKEPSKSILRVSGATNGQKKTLIFASPSRDSSPERKKVEEKRLGLMLMIVLQITSARFPKGKLNYAYVMEAYEKTDKVNWIKVEVQS